MNQYTVEFSYAETYDNDSEAVKSRFLAALLEAGGNCNEVHAVKTSKKSLFGDDYLYEVHVDSTSGTGHPVTLFANSELDAKERLGEALVYAGFNVGKVRAY